MTRDDKISQLDIIIQDALSEMVGPQCVYVDLPYYANVGDVLIWEGTNQFFKRNHITVVYSGSWDTFDFRPIPEEIPIVMQGGGNFGDIWEPPQQFRLSIIKRYPKNRIIILPQTVYYYSEQRIKEDAIIFSSHSNLTICVRDTNSFNLVRKYFKNNVICLPDMAFCIPTKKIRKFGKKTKLGAYLFLKRSDKEYKFSRYETIIPTNVNVRDWPPLENEQSYLRTMSCLIKRRRILTRLGISRIIDFYAYYILRCRIMHEGVRFLSQYERVYTTRLHGAILAILLDKPCVLLNNSYGKNESFYNTWLSDVNEITFVYETPMNFSSSSTRM